MFDTECISRTVPGSVEQLATKREYFRALPSGLSELFSLGPKLADGPHSELIEAEDLQSKQQGLLKILDSEAFGIAERHRILREWSRQQKLVTESDVVVAPLRCGQHEGVIWQYRNNIPGIPLDVVIHDGPLPMGDAIAIAAQIALGLAELHGEGFLHRDLKPEHVLFRGRGRNGPRVALIDAGVSVRIPTHTPYPIFGTVGYVSPEQIAGRLVSFRSDLYALGCVFYEMLTGEKLFKGDDAESILQQHVSAPRPEMPRGLPQAVSRLLASLLERSPRKRPHSAEQVFRTLSPFTDDGVRKSPSMTEGEGEKMQRKIDLGVSDSEELRRATLLGLPAHPSRGKRPPPPPSETLPPPALEAHSVSKPPPVPSAAALSGASRKSDMPVKEGLTTASVSGPPPVNAPGYQSLKPASALPAVNAPGYSSIAPSGLLNINIPLEELDYEDLEDTDAIKAKYEAERDSEGTLVDIPRDPAGTAVLAFDEIEPVEDDDIVLASKAPAAIFDGIDEIAFDDVDEELDEVPAEEQPASGMFESFNEPPEIPAEPELDLPEAVAASAALDLPADGGAPVVEARPPAALKAPEPVVRTPRPVAMPVITSAAKPEPKSNRAVWIAALMGAFVGTVVLGAVALYLSGSQSSSQAATVASAEAAPKSQTPAAAKVAPVASAQPVVAKPPTKRAVKRGEDVKILPMEGKRSAEAEESSVPERRTSRRARRERITERVEKREAQSKERPATLQDVANAASSRQAQAQNHALPKVETKPQASPFDQIRDEAKAAFVARRYQEAAALYQRATTMNPRHAGSFAGLGASRLAQGDARGAALAYIKAVNLAPQNSRYFVALGHSYLRAGDRNNAKRAYQKALSINPNLKSAQSALQKLN